MHNHTAALVNAAHAVLAQLDNGELFVHCEPAISNNVAALDALALAVSATDSAPTAQAALPALRASLEHHFNQSVYIPLDGNVARCSLASIKVLLTAQGEQVVYIVAVPVTRELCRYIEVDAIYSSAADAFAAMVG
ncbi:hypothetical protein GCM10007907_20830 [Chitinimonas prasina]|uniref:Roadblock/LC7 domain-containing protein n=1 Tax=Chitinimonas prasina TaxID=1434937 RepID=A0ABQ5YH15_9NEIS|nr:hypothetical protein [Chitinimonas prasina]GLR13293.1 hypothetical protein GCM10007907_20830 [Chitinimonas prasina]